MGRRVISRAARAYLASARVRAVVGVLLTLALVAGAAAHIWLALTSTLAAMLGALAALLLAWTACSAPVLRVFGHTRYHSLLVHHTKNGAERVLHFGTAFDLAMFAAGRSRSPRAMLADVARGLAQLVDDLRAAGVAADTRVTFMTHLDVEMLAKALGFETRELTTKQRHEVLLSKPALALAFFVTTGRPRIVATSAVRSYAATFGQLEGGRDRIQRLAARLERNA